MKKFAGILYPSGLAPVEFIEYRQVDATPRSSASDRFGRLDPRPVRPLPRPWRAVGHLLGAC
jgi:hypothetical protein